MFSGEIPDFIGNLQSLKVLTLDSCNFTGLIPTSVGNLIELTIVVLSYNNLSGEILLPLSNLRCFWHTYELRVFFFFFFIIIGETGLLSFSLFNLPNLSQLYLFNYQFVGPLPNHVSGLLNLTHLDLSSNFLNGALPSWLFNLPSLEILYIGGNQFIGEIGEFKSNSLIVLDLGYNKLQGSIPRSISRLVNLTNLLLPSNNCSIMLEFEMFSKLQNLYFLDLSNNLVSINNHVTYTLPKLRRQNLSSCNISEFPIFLRKATNFEFLDLSKNRIYGQVPRWLGDMGTYFLDLHDTLLQGPFPNISFSWLEILFISNNKLTEEIPSSICNVRSLEVLDLSHNNFSGMVPRCLVNSSVLSVLDL